MGVVFVVMALIYLGCVEGVNYPPPPICATLECVSYQVVHTQREFEIRNYPTSTWIASANITTVSYSLGRSAGFLQAYIYFRGENKEQFAWNESQRVQPVVTDVIPLTSFDAAYRVYIHVPNDYQNKTLPTPYASSPVNLVKLPPKKLAAVLRYAADLSDKSIAAGLVAFKNTLKGTPWAAAAATPYCSVADYADTNELLLWFDQN